MKLVLERRAAQRNEIAVLRYVPRMPRRASIVAAHGYSSSKQNLDPLCAFLAAHGFEMYSLDFPGHKLGASGGRLRDFEDCLDAMSAIVARVAAQHDYPYLLGHSLGALTAIVTGARDDRVRGVVAIATGYGRPAALTALQKTFTTDLRAEYVDGATLPELFADVDRRLDEALPRLAGRPVLYVAAEHDAMVSVSSVTRLFERAPEPKRLVRVESNHTAAAEYARTPVLQWLNELHPKT